MDLFYFLKVLYRRKWIILGLSFLAVVIAFILLLNKKPLFQSIAQYSTGFTAEKVRMVDGSSAVDFYGADIKFNNVIETFKSPRVVSMISYRLMLHDLQNPKRPYRRLSDKDANHPLAKLVNKDSAIAKLTSQVAKSEMLPSDTEGERVLIEYIKLYKYDYNSLLQFMTIERVGRTDYLDIVFWSENPELSAWVVNAMGEEFLNYYRHLSNQRTEENASSIKSILDQQQKKVDSLGNTLLAEKMKQGTVDPISRSTSAMETVKEIETKLAEAKNNKNIYANRITYLNDRLKGLQAGAASSSGSGEDIIRLTNKKNDLVDQLAKKGGNDPVLQKQIDDLRAEIRQKSGGGTSRQKTTDDIESIKNQVSEQTALLNAANTTIRDYESSIAKYTGMTNVNPGSSVRMSVIQDQLDIENNQLKNIKEKYSQVEGLVKDDPTSNFIQTRVGQPAIDPESKKTMVTMILAGMSMFFLSAVFFLFLEIFDNTIKTPTIFKKHAKIKMATVLNQVPLKGTTVSDIILREEEDKKHARENVFKNNIRKLRHEVMNSGRHIFLLTSTQKKAGKSTVIEALAASLLLSKKKVLLIDMNFSHNTLTRRYETKVYIQDIAGRLDAAQPLSKQNMVSATAYPGLYIIGCKEGNYTPSEALYNIDMGAFLRLAKEEYDYVFLEGAALNYYADSKELSQYAEGVFTVFSAASSLSHVDNESLKFIANLGEKNQGVILNEVLTENINS
jgi:uncharacterized protein involved in exopolysaccharide biosynthesis/Mrp family chromosome partitioning ATPase